MVNMANLQAVASDVGTNIIIGLLIMGVGYGVAAFIERFLLEIFRKMAVEKALKERGLDDALMGFTLPGIIGGIVKWTVFLGFFTSAVNVIESSLIANNIATTPVLTNFTITLVNFLPALLSGVVTIVVGFLLAKHVSTQLSEGEGIHSKTVGAFARLLTIYFTLVVALSNPAYGLNLRPVTDLFNNIILAIAVGLCGGVGLGIGLGIKDSVANVSKKYEKRIEKSLVKK